MAQLVMDRTQSLDWLGVMKCRGQGTSAAAQGAIFLIAMQKNIFRAGVPQHVNPGISGNLLGAVAPENNLSFQIKHTDTDLEAIEYVAVNLGILKKWHGRCEVDC